MTTTMQTSAPAPASAPRRRRLPGALRSRLEQDVAEIRAELARTATKEDLEHAEERIKQHVDLRTADILEAMGCGAGKSSSG